ncbi:MAG TPA: hypothetical protein VFW16_11795 [Streptosporangiaceae bacterium]|nr:hypothetical protein [Streptosporangiaceae bacterium]
MRASGEIVVGWQFVPASAGAGPPPAGPAPVWTDRLDAGWLAAQERISAVVSRPARAGSVAGAAAAVLLGAAWLAGTPARMPAGLGALACAGGAARCARQASRERRRLAAVVAAERQRVEAARASQGRALEARRRAHATQYRAWQRRASVAARRQAWLPVALPAAIDRVDVAGGSLAGWAGLITMIAVPRLGAGGEVTVIDLTEGAVAADLLRVAYSAGLRPLVWVLPADLPRLDLGTGLDAAALADVLALAAAAAGDPQGAGSAAGRRADGGGADAAADCALLERVLGVLGPDPRPASVTAALRALADIGNPLADVSAGLLTDAQLARLGTLFRRGAMERIVVDRAFALESRLRALDALGSRQPPISQEPTRLRVAALDRRAGVIGNRMLGTYVVAAMTHTLRQAAPGHPWAHVICLAGAERLGADVLDRLADACETSRTGLVLAFRSIPASVRERLGRGNAAVAFMRLGNGDDARAASELIGTEHRFVVGQLTDTVGISLTDTWSASYTSTAGTSDSVADSFSASASSGGSRGRGRGRHGFAPFGDFNSSSSRDTNYSAGYSDSTSLTEGINTGTSWGISLSGTLGSNASLGRTAQRSREFLVEAGELQRLPPSAMIVSYPSAAGRTVVLADANPALGGVVQSLADAGGDDGLMAGA